jgi:hypothetical protein
MILSESNSHISVCIDVFNMLNLGITNYLEVNMGRPECARNMREF